MVRIVHTGDMHFDSPFAALPASVARLRKEELRGTFLRILEFVRTYHADVLLIAGDVFDSRFVSADTIVFLRKAFSSIRETSVFIAPGNHDYLVADSPYCTESFGENVHIFGTSFEAIEVGDACIYGCGFPSRFVNSSLLPPSFRHEGDKTGILLMHGDVGTESDYNPIPVAALSQSGLSYAALGHVHAFSGIYDANETKYAYCGIPEGRHFDEGGDCGIIYGEISGRETNLSFKSFSKRKNCTLELDLTGCSGVEAIMEVIRSALTADNLYKVVLSGAIPDTVYIDKDILQKELSNACCFIKIIDKTRPLTGETEDSFLEKLFKERLAERNDEIGQKALRFGLEALRRQKR